MTIADEARDNSISCEMVKYAYRQTKDGVVVSFVVHPNDIPAALSTSHIGARYVAVLVQIGDDELPVQQPAKETSKLPREPSHARPQPVPDKSPVAAKRPWSEKKPSSQAAIRGSDPIFRAFLNETRGYRVQNEEDAAEAVREICKVKSRSEFNVEGSGAALMWNLLESAFLAWQAKERVGA